MAEFAMRNVVNSSTGISPFFANHGYHPRMSFGPPRALPRNALEHRQLRHKDASDFVHKMEDILKLLHTNLITARDSQENFANTSRRAAPAYRVGDMVLLSTKNIDSLKPIPKFDAKFIGPFPIERIINSYAYKLRLPYELQSIHPVFHTNHLKPSAGIPLPGQRNEPTPPLFVDTSGHELWSIDEILDAKPSYALLATGARSSKVHLPGLKCTLITKHLSTS